MAYAEKYTVQSYSEYKLNMQFEHCERKNLCRWLFSRHHWYKLRSTHCPTWRSASETLSSWSSTCRRCRNKPSGRSTKPLSKSEWSVLLCVYFQTVTEHKSLVDASVRDRDAVVIWFCFQLAGYQATSTTRYGKKAIATRYFSPNSWRHHNGRVISS